MGPHRERLERAIVRRSIAWRSRCIGWRRKPSPGSPEALFFGPYDSFRSRGEQRARSYGPFYRGASRSGSDAGRHRRNAGISDELFWPSGRDVPSRHQPGASALSEDARCADQCRATAPPVAENAVGLSKCVGPAWTRHFSCFSPCPLSRKLSAAFRSPPGTIVEDVVYAIEPASSPTFLARLPNRIAAFWMRALAPVYSDFLYARTHHRNSHPGGRLLAGAGRRDPAAIARLHRSK